MIDNPMHLKNLTLKVCPEFRCVSFIRIIESLILNLNWYTSTNRSNHVQELKQLADDIRTELSAMAKMNKSFVPSLSAVELTVAIHHVFHAPVDKILWDIEDQVRFFSFLLATSALCIHGLFDCECVICDGHRENYTSILCLS